MLTINLRFPPGTCVWGFFIGELFVYLQPNSYVMQLSQQLRQDAIHRGLCEEHADGWNKESVFELIEYYKCNTDWCMERQYPALDFMVHNFDTEAVRQQGVYINRDKLELELTPPEGEPIFVFNRCSGTISVKGFTVARVYVSLDSDLLFNIEDNAILILDYYDNAQIAVSNESSRRGIINRYGTEMPLVARGLMTVKEKNGSRTTM